MARTDGALENEQIRLAELSRDDIFEDGSNRPNREIDKSTLQHWLDDVGDEFNVKHWADSMDPNGIKMFWVWGRQARHLAIIIALSITLVGGWFAYVWAIRHNFFTADLYDDDPPPYEVVIGMVLGAFTVVAGPLMRRAGLMLATAPLLTVHSLYTIFIAPAWVIAILPRRSTLGHLQICMLCSHCRSITADPLLSGTGLVLTRSHKQYLTHGLEGLR